MKIGSAEHKERFCQQFVASHCRFNPATLAWPDLDEAALSRLRGIPFWEEVLYTERRAGAIVAALLFGFVQVAGSVFLPDLAALAPYVLLMAVLLVAPRGIGRGRVLS